MKDRAFDPAQVQVLDSSHGRQTVLKVETSGGPVVVKRFLRKRSWLRQGMMQLGCWTFAGKSNSWPRGRRRTEAECMALWQRHGFDVFRVRDAAVPLEVREPHLILEFCPGRTLYDILEDPTVREEEKRGLLERFSSRWGERHHKALDLMEPRLLHEHGSFRHVFVSGPRLITFDLEVAWVRRRLTPHLVGREVASFLRSLGRASRGEGFEERLEAVVDAYPHPDLLRTVVEDALHPSSPVRRIAFIVEHFLRRQDPHAPGGVFRSLQRLLK